MLKRWPYPPFWGSRNTKNPLWSPENTILAEKRPVFDLRKGLFTAPGPASAVGVENGAIWVKKSTSRILVQKWVLKVGEAEKRVFMPFWAVFEVILSVFSGFLWGKGAVLACKRPWKGPKTSELWEGKRTLNSVAGSSRSFETRYLLQPLG